MDDIIVNALAAILAALPGSDPLKLIEYGGGAMLNMADVLV